MNEDIPVMSVTDCSPLNALFSGVQITLISHGIPVLGSVKQGRGGKN